MLCVWVHGCELGRVSDSSRLALYQTFSIECLFLSFSGLCFVLLFLSFCRFVLFLCSRWSSVDVPLIFSGPTGHVPDWQPRILLGMVEARSVNVKNTTEQCQNGLPNLLSPYRERLGLLSPANGQRCQQQIEQITIQSSLSTSPRFSRLRHTKISKNVPRFMAIETISW